MDMPVAERVKPYRELVPVAGGYDLRINFHPGQERAMKRGVATPQNEKPRSVATPRPGENKKRSLEFYYVNYGE